MAKTGAVGMSTSDLRIRVNALADRIGGRLETTADRIRAESRDPAVGRRALVFKIDAFPAVYIAAYRSDPLVAVLDVWALTFQVSQYVTEGGGRDAFGPQQSLARKGADLMLADADAVMRQVATGPEAFARARARVAAWAKGHTVQETFSSRPSVAGQLADLGAERDVFAVVGAVSETIENVADRLNAYAAQLPKQARWHAELLVLDTAREHGVDEALGDVHAVGAAARRANDLLADVPGLLKAGEAPIREMLSTERRAVLEGVNVQRVQTLEYLTALVAAERLAVLAAASEERKALVAALRQERIETLTEVDAIKNRFVDSGLSGLRDLVDYTLWRVALLLAVFLVLTAALGVVGYWLTLGRRFRASSA